MTIAEIIWQRFKDKEYHGDIQGAFETFVFYVNGYETYVSICHVAAAFAKNCTIQDLSDGSVYRRFIFEDNSELSCTNGFLNAYLPNGCRLDENSTNINQPQQSQGNCTCLLDQLMIGGCQCGGK